MTKEISNHRYDSNSKQLKSSVNIATDHMENCIALNTKPSEVSITLGKKRYTNQSAFAGILIPLLTSNVEENNCILLLEIFWW
jgi:hypothetical protein